MGVTKARKIGRVDIWTQGGTNDVKWCQPVVKVQQFVWYYPGILLKVLRKTAKNVSQHI
jgi:hypothetical protein